MNFNQSHPIKTNQFSTCESIWERLKEIWATIYELPQTKTKGKNTFKDVVRSYVAPSAVVMTDSHLSYVGLSAEFQAHPNTWSNIILKQLTASIHAKYQMPTDL